MKSTSLPDGAAVQFNLMDIGAINLLNEYTKTQLSKIPSDRRPDPSHQKRITARWFIKKFQRDFLPLLRRESDVPEGYVPIAELYNILVCLSSEGNHSFQPYEEYEFRSRVLRSFLHLSEGEIVDNNLGYCHDDSYLFTCLFEIIYKDWDLPDLEREVLNNCMGYSHQYRMLTQAELAEKLNIPKYKVLDAVIDVERKVDHLIKKFKIFSPYFVYRAKGALNGNLIELRPSLFDDIKEEEGNEIMTNLFITKVISITCNYKMVVICSEGRNIYLLIKPGMKDSVKNFIFFNRLRKLLNAKMRTSETEDIVDGLVICMEEEFPQDPDNYANEEEVVFEEFDNSGEDEDPEDLTDLEGRNN
jgi:hypothetical protein